MSFASMSDDRAAAEVSDRCAIWLTVSEGDFRYQGGSIVVSMESTIDSPLL